MNKKYNSRTFKALVWFSSTFLDRFNSQGLFKKAYYIQSTFVQTLPYTVE